MFNKKQIIFALATTAMFLPVSPAFAGGVGTTAAQFLKIGVGARALAMGGAFSAISDDLSAIYWNPAGLATQKKKQATASYSQYFQGIKIGFMGYSQKSIKNGVLGIGLNYLTIDGIDRRTGDTDANEGTFGANDMALYISYAKKDLFESVKGLKLGANLKIIRQTIDATTANSYALDLGALYDTPVKKLTAGFGIYNLGTEVKFINDADPLPLEARVGFAYRMLNDSLVAAVDLQDYVTDQRMYEQAGVEYTYKKSISIRGGYKLGMDSSSLGGMAGMSAGVGFNIWGVQLDYAFVPYGELDDTHRLTISTKF